MCEFAGCPVCEAEEEPEIDICPVCGGTEKVYYDENGELIENADPKVYTWDWCPDCRG
jgi:hypothetical protein